MSEETGVAIAPSVEAPAVVAPAIATVESTEVQDLEVGKGQAGARRNTRRRIEQAAQRQVQAEAARERALGQPRREAGAPEGGQFKTDGADVEPVAPSVVVAPAPTAAVGSQVDTAVATAPAGWVDIAIPEGHPIRENRGKKSIRVPAEDEAEVRHGFKQYFMVKDLEVQTDHLRRENAMLQARREALSGGAHNYETDPRYQALINQVQEAPGFGPEMAKQVLEGLKARDELALIRAERGAEADLNMQRTARQIAGDIETRAEQLLGIWAQSGETKKRLDNPTIDPMTGKPIGLINQYYTAIDAEITAGRRTAPPSADEFFMWVKPAYQADPRVQSAIKNIQSGERQREQERIRLEVRAEFEKEQKAKAAEALQRHASRPPLARGLPSSSTPSVEAGQAPPATPRHGQHRQDARARIRQRYTQ